MIFVSMGWVFFSLCFLVVRDCNGGVRAYNFIDVGEF